MTGFKNKVIHLATDKQQEDVQLVVNLFQSVLDGFIRGEVKKEEAEPAKVTHRFRTLGGRNMKSKRCSHTCVCLLADQSQKEKEEKG